MTRPIIASSIRVRPSTDGPLVASLRVSRKLRPFIDRMRMTSKDVDLCDPIKTSEFGRCRETMRKILAKKKIAKSDAEKIIDQTLDAAADHQLERLRRDRLRQRLEQSTKDLRRLNKHIDRLAYAILALSPISIGELNKIIAGQDWQHFDTEMFCEIVDALQHALSTLSPAVAANKARLVIRESLRASGDRAVAQIVRTARPAISELWEIIPAQTRTHVEAEMQRWTAPKRGQIAAFLRRLVVLLKTYRPTVETRRPPAIEGRYLRKVGKIWRGFGLNVGRAHDGAKIESVESPFQRFARLALSAVGDSSRISERQITNLKSEWRRQRDRQSK